MAASAPHPSSNAEISRRLVATREALGIGQAELCRRTGIRTNTYNQWEGGFRPGLDGALALCAALGYTLDWIYRGDPSGLPERLATRLRLGIAPVPSRPRR